MKSLKNFLEEQQGRKEFLETRPKTETELNVQRKRLANIPVLTDDEMRAQNPGATAAYEKDAKERRGRRRTVTVDTPEGQIIAGGTSKSGKIEIKTPSGEIIHVTPDEAVARTEAGLKPSVRNKPKRVVSRSNASTQSAPAPAPAPIKPEPAATQNISLNRQPAPKPNVGSPLTVSSPKPKPTKNKLLRIPRASQSQRLANTVVQAAKQVRTDMAAEKAAEKAKMMKGLGTAGKVLGLVQTGIEANKGYDIAKALGSSQKRSVGAGAARAIGSGLGGLVGGTFGSVLGPLGSAAGATAGLTVGAELGSKAYDVITGDPKKKVTTQGVLTNIRKAVPQEIRAQVPANVRKGFTDFVKSAGRTYGNWQRSQEAKK